MIPGEKVTKNHADRRRFIGGSDARIIFGDDEAALLRLWREKRGEVEPEDLSGNLIVQLGLATDPLNGPGTSAIRARNVQLNVRSVYLRFLAA